MNVSTTTLLVQKSFAGNPPVELNALQRFLEPHATTIVHAWVVLWILTALFVLLKLHRDYRSRR